MKALTIYGLIIVWVFLFINSFIFNLFITIRKTTNTRGLNIRLYYLLLNCGAFLAFLSPYFFLSLTLESLVKYPKALNDDLFSSSASTNALAIPNLKAPACPENPPPWTLAIISNFVKALTASKGCDI